MVKIFTHLCRFKSGLKIIRRPKVGPKINNLLLAGLWFTIIPSGPCRAYKSDQIAISSTMNVDVNIMMYCSLYIDICLLYLTIVY